MQCAPDLPYKATYGFYNGTPITPCVPAAPREATVGVDAGSTRDASVGIGGDLGEDGLRRAEGIELTDADNENTAETAETGRRKSARTQRAVDVPSAGCTTAPFGGRVELRFATAGALGLLAHAARRRRRSTACS
jgi:hypothetical protein